MRYSALTTLLTLATTANGLVMLPATHFGQKHTPANAHQRIQQPRAFFNFGKKDDTEAPARRGGNARDDDLARRQSKLAERQAAAKAIPKGQVEVTFPQKNNKVVLAKQGEDIGKVAARAGLRVKFDCKNGRCGTCQVRLNGRAAAKVCQGAVVPSGATRRLSVTLDNL